MSTPIVAPPVLLKFHGALYRRAIRVGDGAPFMTADQVADLLAEQYHNLGKTSAKVLKRRWVLSPLFILTEIYPSLPIVGVSAGKTGETYSSGQPLVVDRDIRSIAVANPDGSQPRYLVLDGQNRLVKLRREAPFRLYPAYVGMDIVADVERATKLLSAALKRKCRLVRRPEVDGLL